MRNKNNSYPKIFFRLQADVFVIFALIALILITGCSTLSSDQSVSGSPFHNQTVHFTDSANNSVSLPHPAERIVSLQRDSIECLIDMGAGDRIVGVPDYVAEDPHFMSRLPNAITVGASATPNIETISSLKPDVIILMTSSPANLKTQLNNLNLSVAYFDCYILQDIPSSIRNLGLMTGKSENAEKYLTFYEKYDALISERLGNISGDQQPDVYFELSTDYLTAGKGSGGDALLQNIQANNIAHNLTPQWPKISPEWVVSNNPDIIIKMEERSTERKNNFNILYESMVNRSGFSGISAIQNDRVYVVSGNILYGPRGIIGQLYLGKIIYPDRFDDIDPDEVLHQYASEFLPNSDDIDTLYPGLNSSPRGSQKKL